MILHGPGQLGQLVGDPVGGGSAVCGAGPQRAGHVEDGPDVLRVRITSAEARAFVERARRVVSAGRPPCPLCGLPLDAGGHICPRQNGYRRASAA